MVVGNVVEKSPVAMKQLGLIEGTLFANILTKKQTSVLFLHKDRLFVELKITTIKTYLKIIHGMNLLK